MTYSVDIPQLTTLANTFARSPELVAKETSDAINRSLVTIQGQAKRNAPVDTSTLQNSIIPVLSTPQTLSGSVGTPVKYAVWVERGTGLYGPYATPIVPTTAKAMKFQIGGQTFIRRSTKGMKPTWFFKRAIDDTHDTVLGYFQAALDSVARQLGGSR